MKVCPNCNNTVEDGAIFCDKCGTRFAVQSNAQVNYAQQPNNQVNYTQQQYNYAANQPQYQQPIQQPTQPKKKNTGMIIGIVAAVLIVLAIIGSIAQKAFQDQGYGDGGNDYTPSYNFSTNDSSSNDDTSSTIDNNVSDVKAYNKGSMVDGWYVNEWANMKFDANSNWTDGSADEYGSYEGDPNTECGVILNDTANGKQLVICFEKLNGPSASVTEAAYLDIITDGLKKQYSDANLTCNIADYFDTTIAGETFKTAKITFEEGPLVQEFHVRKYDSYMIFVAVTAQSSFDASSTANNIRTIK